ncbi:hypothetical protein MKZ38_006241 [Zalerion maritima]|uniref:Uncharacterized protein n=1 Tax=Zalerion maritima TaxID=339359 RepID=A0AAD5WPR6_9PEZI|nr:hypothetical protein MKZ38_006241 [Zalerion maritima]
MSQIQDTGISPFGANRLHLFPGLGKKSYVEDPNFTLKKFFMDEEKMLQTRLSVVTLPDSVVSPEDRVPSLNMTQNLVSRLGSPTRMDAVLLQCFCATARKRDLPFHEIKKVWKQMGRKLSSETKTAFQKATGDRYDVEDIESLMAALRDWVTFLFDAPCCIRETGNDEEDVHAITAEDQEEDEDMVLIGGNEGNYMEEEDDSWCELGLPADPEMEDCDYGKLEEEVNLVEFYAWMQLRYQ